MSCRFACGRCASGSGGRARNPVRLPAPAVHPSGSARGSRAAGDFSQYTGLAAEAVYRPRTVAEDGAWGVCFLLARAYPWAWVKRPASLQVGKFIFSSQEKVFFQSGKKQGVTCYPHSQFSILNYHRVSNHFPLQKPPGGTVFSRIVAGGSHQPADALGAWLQALDGRAGSGRLQPVAEVADRAPGGAHRGPFGRTVNRRNPSEPIRTVPAECIFAG